MSDESKLAAVPNVARKRNPTDMKIGYIYKDKTLHTIHYEETDKNYLFHKCEHCHPSRYCIVVDYRLRIAKSYYDTNIPSPWYATETKAMLAEYNRLCKLVKTYELIVQQSMFDANEILEKTEGNANGKTKKTPE